MAQLGGDSWGMGGQVRRANSGVQRGDARGLSPWSSEGSTHGSQDGAPNGTCTPGTPGPRRGGRFITLAGPWFSLKILLSQLLHRVKEKTLRQHWCVKCHGVHRGEAHPSPEGVQSPPSMLSKHITG